MGIERFSVILLCAARAEAQAPYLDLVAPDGDHGFGSSVAGAGDVDLDGHADVIVGSPGSASLAGRAWVFSGATGASLLALSPPVGGGHFGVSVAGAGDVNGDGIPDLIVGETYNSQNGSHNGAARVYSGADGALMHTFYGEQSEQLLGYDVAGVGDVDGDGLADLAVASRGGTARVDVFAGSNGARITSWTYSGSVFRIRIAALGDVDGDGVLDLAVALQFNSSSSLGRLEVRSCSNGAVRWTRIGSAINANLGWSVALAGDIDLDGHPDVVAGEVGESAARVFSGTTGALLRSLTGACDAAPLGVAVAGVGDSDGDGHADVIATRSSSIGGFGGPSAQVALLFSGANGRLLELEHRQLDEQWFGCAADAAGDVDGDGHTDWIVGAKAHFDPPGLMGHAYVYRGGSPVPGFEYCFGDGTSSPCPCGNASASGAAQGCLNSVGTGARLSALGSRSVSIDDLTILASGLPPNPASGILFAGTAQIDAPFRDGVRCAGGSIVRLQFSSECPTDTRLWGPQLSAAGLWTAGETRYFQAWYRDAYGPCGTGANLSTALRVSFLP